MEDRETKEFNSRILLIPHLGNLHNFKSFYTRFQTTERLRGIKCLERIVTWPSNCTFVTAIFFTSFFIL